ncbi:SH3 domain-containing protein [Roseofilum casamattae]|uniref:SH3 domain-containing protein n=1 Tax=Roseofilum casamattae BLCC-M143 TaxID=3022442 RepID=A0ABT7BWG9_9CYAN|nr:SH3 domain-containing protein [Roseofilum casamattae]MDJ1183521.1 SH3 domain-containing protein [Roseofilum casamattae BLCC-M143]
MALRLLSGFLQVIFGVALAVALMVAGGVATARYIMAKMSISPPKPEFPEPQVAQTTPTDPTQTAEAAKPKEPDLPEGAYKAKVTWPDGLILRDAPTYEANSIGGVGYNEVLYVIGESEDKIWQKVRAGSQDAWVKGGNVEKVN